ncbi:MAG: shikimate kinase [Campylobacterales bacterium]|nr:shikimate kinase [Campylobacterales bacterium]
MKIYDNVVLIGFMGSGKTSVGKILARHLFKEFVDVDTLIETEQNATISEIFAEHGEEYFRTLESECLAKLTQKTGQVIATGGGLPIYNKIPEKSLVVFIDADFDVILRRLSAKEHAKRPLLQDEKRARALFDERIDTYRQQATFVVDANQSINTFIHVIRDFILDKRVL